MAQDSSAERGSAIPLLRSNSTDGIAFGAHRQSGVRQIDRLQSFG
jgi:hypothetical protein